MGLANCDIDQLCINTAGGFTCGCLSGYVIVNGTCEDIDECADDKVCALYLFIYYYFFKVFSNQ